MEEHASDPSIQETEVGVGSQAQAQPGLHRETLSQIKKM